MLDFFFGRNKLPNPPYKVERRGETITITDKITGSKTVRSFPSKAEADKHYVHFNRYVGDPNNPKRRHIYIGK